MPAIITNERDEIKSKKKTFLRLAIFLTLYCCSVGLGFRVILPAIFIIRRNDSDSIGRSSFCSCRSRQMAACVSAGRRSSTIADSFCDSKKCNTFSASRVSSNNRFWRLAGTGIAAAHTSSHILPLICIRVLREPAMCSKNHI